jgi:GcrA cell cycle regulator
MSWARVSDRVLFSVAPGGLLAGRGSSILPQAAHFGDGLTNEATMAWTDEIVEQLKQHWTDGKSASQIASLLGNGVTRNAVIGKVHRLGLAGRAKTPGSAASRPRRLAPPPAHRAAGPRVSPAAHRIVRGATALAIAPEALAEAIEPEFESVVVPMSLRVTIVELKESMCRWPLGDPASSEFRYCGSPTATRPYCAYHASLAYQPAQERRRDRDRDRARRVALR